MVAVCPLQLGLGRPVEAAASFEQFLAIAPGHMTAQIERVESRAGYPPFATSSNPEVVQYEIGRRVSPDRTARRD